MYDEGDMRWAPGLGTQPHARLIGRSISLEIVAADAGRNQVFPTVRAADGSRDDMIDGYGQRGGAAVLATVSVAAEYVFPRKDYAPVWNPLVPGQSDDARERKSGVDRANHLPVRSRDHFRLLEIKQDHGLLRAAHGDRFITLVEYEHPAVQAPRRVWFSIFEDILL